jgi:Mg2+/Co2+ transporter CorC
MRDFQVKKGVMGYIVTIGCQVAGFTTKEDLLKAITEYVNDPEATEKKYYQPKSGWDNQIAVDPVSAYGGTSDTFGTRLSNANANTTAFGQR